ncbi:hypothetical protein KL933_004790 [Ogataea haglerorum]|uniref:Uncharacterized protein n=1 Tax=Ogataea haglerorum TaxID=1937702 RepID=A0AAN6D1R7_9ASCO|nr:hypothetical protein KL933_004790 [Ogataea haglerorum]KAG7731744.1 hypothetical protein KL948_002677 [Ogataea haglerorum]KAG7769508.1 hypothetical protein KL931_002754 [Ogataea haglerorum]
MAGVQPSTRAQKSSAQNFGKSPRGRLIGSEPWMAPLPKISCLEKYYIRLASQDPRDKPCHSLELRDLCDGVVQAVVHLAVEFLVDLLQRQALDLDKRPPDNHRLRKIVHAVDHVVLPRDVVERDRDHVLVEEAEPERDDLRERHALRPDTVVDNFDRVRHAQRRVAERVRAAEQEHHEDQRVGGVDVGSVRVVLLDCSHDEQTHAHEHRGPQQDEHPAKPFGQVRAGARKEQVRDLQTEVQHDLPSRGRVAGVLEEQPQIGAHDVASGELRGHAHPENDPQSPAVASGLQHGHPADLVLLLVAQDLLDFLELERHQRSLLAVAVVVFQNLQGLVLAVGVHEEPRRLWDERQQRQTQHGRRDLPQRDASPGPTGIFGVSTERNAGGDYRRQIPAGHVHTGEQTAVLRFDHLGNVRGGAHRVDGDGHADNYAANDEHGPVAGPGLQAHTQKRQHRSDEHAPLTPHAANIDQLSSKKTSENRADVDGGGKKPLHVGVQVEKFQILVDHVEVGHHALVHAHGAPVDDGAR